MGCLDDQLVHRFVTGALDGTARSEVEAELARCARCTALVAAVMRHGADDGRYELDAPIARGGMGTIVRATDRLLGRTVALKRLNAVTPAMQMRFEREIRITASLQHPNIVPIYDAGILGDGHPFYAMRHVPGRSLEEAIAAARPEERASLLGSLAAATDAVAYAHERGVIHRDLKPLNILVGPFGETVVIDWGLAKVADAVEAPWIAEARAAGAAATHDGAILGTPRYMAPEQARGEPATPASDVYGLGAILYHALSGVPPVDAASVTAALDRVAGGRVTPLATLAPQLPRDLTAIVHRAMALRPEDRYPSARELAADLRRFQTGQMVTAYRYTRPDRAGRFARRHRVALAVGAVFAAITIAVGTWSLVRIVAARDAAYAAQVTAEGERERAERERTGAEALVQFVLSDLRTTLAKVGRLDALRAAADRVDAYLHAAGRADDDATLRARARVLELRATVAYDAGDDPAAARLLGEARATLDRLDARRASGTDEIRAALDTLEAVSEARTGDDPRVLASLRGAAARWRTVIERADAGARPEAELNLAAMLIDVGQAEDRLGHAADADATWREASEVLQHAAPHRPDAAGLRTVWLRVAIGQSLVRRGRTPDAEAELDAALALADRLAARDPNAADTRMISVKALNVLADIRTSLGRAAEARALRERAHEHVTAMAAIEPSDARIRGALARSWFDLGRDAHHAGDRAAALARWRRADEEYERLLAASPGDRVLRRGAGMLCSELAELERALGEPAAARRTLGKAVAHFEALAATGAVAARLDLAYMLQQAAAFERTAGALAAAAAFADRALTLVEATRAPDTQPRPRFYGAAVLAEAAAIAARRGETARAGELRARAVAIADDLARRGELLPHWRAELVQAGVVR